MNLRVAHRGQIVALASQLEHRRVKHRVARGIALGDLALKLAADGNLLPRELSDLHGDRVGAGPLDGDVVARDAVGIVDLIAERLRPRLGDGGRVRHDAQAAAVKIADD